MGWGGPPLGRGLRPPCSGSFFSALPSFSLGVLPGPLRKSQPLSWPCAVARPGHVYSSPGRVYSSPLHLEGRCEDTREVCGRGSQWGAVGTLAKARTGAGLCPGEGRAQLIPGGEGCGLCRPQVKSVRGLTLHLRQWPPRPPAPPCSVSLTMHHPGREQLRGWDRLKSSRPCLEPPMQSGHLLGTRRHVVTLAPAPPQGAGPVGHITGVLRVPAGGLTRLPRLCWDASQGGGGAATSESVQKIELLLIGR